MSAMARYNPAPRPTFLVVALVVAVARIIAGVWISTVLLASFDIPVARNVFYRGP
jgi:hypothetical protein